MHPKRKLAQHSQPCKKALEYRQQLKIKATPAELAMRDILMRIGTAWKFQKLFQREGIFRIVDFYLPFPQIVIEVDGAQHFTKKGRNYDRNREKFLMRTCRIKKFLRFSNSKVLLNPREVELEIGREIYPDFELIEKIANEFDAIYMGLTGFPKKKV